MRSLLAVLTVFAALLASSGRASAQAFPPGTFSVDGIPVACGANTFVLTPQLNDVGMNDMQGHIYLNPNLLAPLPTVLKLYWIAHECGHSFVGLNESSADCWAIRTGRNQGWFPPAAFELLMAMFRNNPGDMAHPTGPARVEHMLECYQAP